MPGDPLQEFLQSLPPERLQAILGTGTADQQQAMLERQLQQAHQLRLQRAGQQPYGAGAGMAAGLGGILGGVQEGMLQNRADEALKQRQAGIHAFGQSVQGGGGNMQGAALLGLLSGNKQLGEMGQGISQIPMQQAQLQEAQQKVSAGERLKQLRENPANIALASQALGRFGIKTGADTANADYEAIKEQESYAEKFAATQETAAARKAAAKDAAEARKAAAQNAQLYKDQAMREKEENDVTKTAKEQAKDWDAARASSRTAFGSAGSAIFQGGRTLAAIHAQIAAGQNPNQVSPAAMQIAAESLTKMVTGGVPTAGEIAAITPKDIKGDAAGIMQWLFSEPQALDRKMWIQQYESIVNKEEANANRQVRESQLKNTQGLQSLVRRGKLDQARQLLQDAELDQPDPNGYIDPQTFKVVKPPKTQGGGLGSDDLRKKYGL